MSFHDARFTISTLGFFLCAPISAQVTQRVSLDSAGAQVSADSQVPAFSADLRTVAFGSFAWDLVPGDTNGTSDVFVRDRFTGATERVSVDSSGAQADSGSYAPSISADGRYVLFTSNATNLVPGDTNGVSDIFLHDRQTGTTTRVSVATGGTEADDASDTGSITPDGRFVVFESGATNLVPGDANHATDIFVRDLQSATTERVSLGSGGVQAIGPSGRPCISADGRFVAFTSLAANLVVGDTNGQVDIFVRDRQFGTTERVSIASDGTQANNFSFDPSISAGGRYVTFWSYSNNLVAGDTNGHSDVFVRDRQFGRTDRVSLSSTGAQGNADSRESSSVSDDGRYVVFLSTATNLVSGPTDSYPDVFLRDRQSGTTEQVSVDSSGTHAGESSMGPLPMTSDGRFIAFASLASNLVPGDTNGSWDIFLRDRRASGFTSQCSPGVDGVSACPCSNPAGGPDRGCDNSSATGGAVLSAAGIAYLSMDSLVFTTSGERPTATSILLQGTTTAPNGVVYGQGVRCVGGALTRLFTKTASGGGITAPDFGAGDPSVSARSAAKGDTISPGQSRWYLAYYRDPIVLGGCPASSTFNATQSGQVTWSP